MIIGIDAHQLEGVRTGVGRYLYNLLKQWNTPDSYVKQKGISFILYFKNSVPGDCAVFKAPLFVKRVLKTPFDIDSKFLYYNVSITKAARCNAIDVMFFPFYMLPLTYWGKAIVVVHDISYKVHPEWFSKGYGIPLRVLTYIALRRAYHILTVSKFSAQQILKYYPFVKSDHISTTPLGVDDVFMKTDYKKIADTVLKTYQCKPFQYLLYVGSIFNRRHVNELIQAFESLAPDYPSMKLLLIGRDLTHPAQYIDQIIFRSNSALGREAILRKSFISDEDLVVLYRYAQAFVLLSEYEGFGLPPLEAMACGTPVISTHKTSLKETVDDAGIIVADPNSIKEVSQALRSLLEDKTLRKELIARGKAHVTRFSWEATAKKTLEIITRI